MTDATTLTAPRPAGSRVHLEYPLTRENLQAAFRKALNWNRPFADRPGDAQFSGVTAVADVGGAQLGTLLRPIATPLVMAGFEPEIADMLGGAFREQGFIPMGGNAAGFRAGEKPFEGPLKPDHGCYRSPSRSHPTAGPHARSNSAWSTIRCSGR